MGRAQPLQDEWLVKVKCCTQRITYLLMCTMFFHKTFWYKSSGKLQLDRWIRERTW